jgi:hypothetical protein
MERTPDPFGRDAIRPLDIPVRGWWQVAERVLSESSRDNLSVVAGCEVVSGGGLRPLPGARILSTRLAISRQLFATWRHASLGCVVPRPQGDGSINLSRVVLLDSHIEEAPTMRARASSTLKKEVRRDDGGDHHHPLKLPHGAD